MLFQGPIGTYAIPQTLSDELAKIVNAKYPHDEVAQIREAASLIHKWSLNGSMTKLYFDCWYESGITAGNRQLAVDSLESILHSMCNAQVQFDSFDWLIKAKTVNDIIKAKKENKKAGIVTCQSTIGFGKNLNLLDAVYDFGLRVVQLTYNNQNLVGSGCMEPHAGGISVFGQKFIKKLNELGIVVDTGHCNKQTTLDACKYSNAPVIASHTAVEKVYKHNRAKSDDEIKAIADTGGVIGVFAVPWFIAEDPQNTSLNDFLNHLEYIINLVGVDHVAIGTDWPMPQTKWMATKFKKHISHTIGFAKGDGPSTEYIKGFKDYRQFKNITRGLVAKGYSDATIKKILGENWLRVFKEVW